MNRDYGGTSTTDAAASLGAVESASFWVSDVEAFGLAGAAARSAPRSATTSPK
eukprot:SAG11_NODE_29741_length_307_cov_2.153846_1_plen_52_part_10